MSGGGSDFNFDEVVLTAELTKLRTPGLRSRTDKIDLSTLEAISRLLADDGEPVADQIKATITVGAEQMAELRRLAVVDLLDAGPRHRRRVYVRREHVAKQLGVTPKHLEGLEDDLFAELARHLVRLAREHESEPGRPAPTKAEVEPSADGVDRQISRSPIATPRRTTRGRTVLAVVAVLGIAGLVWTQWLHTGGASVPRAALASLKAESERELIGDQAPVQGDGGRLLGFGDPTPEGRTTYPYVSHNSKPGTPGYGTPASPTPTLNVLTDVPHGTGDERRFVYGTTGTATHPHASEVTRRSVFARDGQYVWLRIYVDNGASPEPDCRKLAGPTVAQRTTLRVAAWDSPDRRLHVVRTWVYAENASPRWITDAVPVLTESSRTLELVPSLSSQYSEQPTTYLSHPPLTSSAIVEPAGMLLGGNGLLGSCWQNRFVLLLVFRQA